ncbi:MAG TPA: hypothetical protein PKN30_12125, partial [Flavobacteriales bacterium]|nr:hypothetical protein [Flavobacteriales bacterium]
MRDREWPGSDSHRTEQRNGALHDRQRSQASDQSFTYAQRSTYHSVLSQLRSGKIQRPLTF